MADPALMMSTPSPARSATHPLSGSPPLAFAAGTLLPPSTAALSTEHSFTAQFLRPHRRTIHLATLFLLWLAIFAFSAATPSLLDDADATHAQAAQSMLRTGDWVTLHVNGVRYLEKPPLPYWIAALSLRVFGQNSFAIHLPLALTVLALSLLGFFWAERAFGARSDFSARGDFEARAALYTGLFVLTSAGVFLFTRIFIPDALLSLLLALALYAALHALDDGTAHPRRFAYIAWSALACAVLTKGFVAIIFLFGSLALYLQITQQWPRWRRLHPLTGGLLFLLLAAPWHILAALRNPPIPIPAGLGFPPRAGWTWFYLYNEHIARFLGHRIPHDYNKLPAALYWSLHIVWLFPWSLFAPAALVLAWRNLRRLHPALEQRTLTFAQRSILLLSLFSALILIFFSLSTNQEYYTFPIYLPLLLLLAASLAHIEQSSPDPTLRRTLTFAHASFTLTGLAIASALVYGLWTSRHLPFAPDIGAQLAHRGIGDYTLSLSHFFDLTGPSFAALRLPAALAALAFALGPPIAWLLRTSAANNQARAFASTLTIALTSTVFLLAAHIALVRFSPMLSSRDFASTLQHLEDTHAIAPDTRILLFGDQAYGSSIPFYLGHPVSLVDGRTTSMLFGSLFPDAPPLFLTSGDLRAQWGTGPRKILFVPLEQRDTVDHLLGPHPILLQETSGKALLTDRPLNPETPAPTR